MRVKIVARADSTEVQIVDAETGERVEGVTAVRWGGRVGRPHEATLTLRGVELEIESEVAESRTPEPRTETIMTAHGPVVVPRGGRQ